MSETETMVERVADAVIGVLEKSDDADLTEGIGHILGLGSPAKISSFKAAIGRAAIAAMREPTAGMLAAADAESLIGSDGLWPGEAHHTWPAMIDAALNDGANADGYDSDQDERDDWR